MAFIFDPPTPMKRSELYSNKAHLQIRALGTEEWYAPPSYPGWEEHTSSNLARTTFTSSSISVQQNAVRPTFDATRSLKSHLYYWHANFSVADLYDIRVKETEFAAPKDDNTNAVPKIRIEIVAVCRAAPTAHGMFVGKGSLLEKVLSNAKPTTEPTASSCGLAKISERWASGDQEIRLSFTRTTQTVRKSGKNQVEGVPDPVAGAKVWVWHAFLAFLSGSDWTSSSLDQFSKAAHMNLADIVNKDCPSPHVSLEEKEDGWVSVKIDDAEKEKRAKRLARFGPSATSSTTTPSVLPERPSTAILGKRKMSGNLEEAGGGKRMEIETRESLKEEIHKMEARAEVFRDEEHKWRVRAEEEEEKVRQLQLQLEMTDR